MSDAVAWFALALALVELVFLVGVVVLCWRFWKRTAPMVAPLLQMFAMPQPITNSTSSGAIPAGEREEPPA